MASCISCQCFFCHQCTFFKCASDPNTDYHRRTGIRSCIFHRRQNCIFHAVDSLCRLQHKYTAHIFTAEPFRCNLDLHPVTFHDPDMKNRRSIIFCIFADQWIPYNGFTEISFHISLPYTFIYCFFQAAAFKVYILSDLQKDNCHSCILTDRDHILCGYLKIFLKLSKDLLSKR